MKLRTIWDKIKPLDYKKNPIGSLKLEIYFWVALISLISYISGSTETFNMIFNIGLFHLPFWLIIIFGIITIVFEDEDENKKQYGLGPVITTALTFFLGEMGDKTQLTCMTLSMDAYYHSAVLAGSVTAMLAIGLAGIIIGTSLTKFIPSYIIKTISGLIFIIFGVVRMII